MKSHIKALQAYTCYIPFDAEFHADFEFDIKILISPTHFEISAIFKICVGGFKKFLPHWNKNKISYRMICILHMFAVSMTRNQQFSKKWLIRNYSWPEVIFGDFNPPAPSLSIQNKFRQKKISIRQYQVPVWLSKRFSSIKFQNRLTPTLLRGRSQFSRSIG